MGIGLPHLLIILVIAMLIFGPGKLPELGKSLGTAIGEFKKTVSGVNPEKDKPAEGEDHTV